MATVAGSTNLAHALCRMTLLRIVAPHFVAGVFTDGALVRDAAPILAYMVGWTRAQFATYVRRKGWTVERIA